LAKPERSSTPRPSSKKRKAGEFAEVVVHNQGLSSPISRPGTSSTVITPDHRNSQPPTDSSSAHAPTSEQRPLGARVEVPHHTSSRRPSVIRHEEASSPREIPEEGTRRESVSSRGSWIRRLSTIPNSYNNSPRSSVGPDSPSINLSHGSAAPILSNPASSPVQLPPNKLVKRTTSGRAISGPLIRSSSRSQLPTLRRPATSHQRSVTLQQQFRNDSMAKEPVQQSPSNQAPPIPPIPANKFGTPTPESRHAWRLYFDSRPTKLTKERTSGRSSDGGMQNFQSTSRRVIPDENVTPTLVKPAMILVSTKASAQYYYDDSFGSDDMIEDDIEIVDETAIPSTEASEEPQKRARRSLSMNFSSPTSWISRAGSLRGNKRNTEGRSGGKRYSSAPVPNLPGRNITSAHGPSNPRHRLITDPTVFQRQPISPIEDPSPIDPFSMSFQARSRNSSSPLPPLSRLSSFNIDLARLGLSSSSSSAPRRSPTTPVLHTHTTSTSLSSTGHASPVSAIFFTSHNNKAPRTSEVGDRASTLVGSDNDAKGFTSGDEDDMDFQSETVFDSLRSGATGSIRSHNAPLDSMFDESPPSLNGHAKSKRLSIHEMLNNGGFQEGNNRIVEEDEGMSTPVKGARSRSSQERALHTPVRSGAMDTEEAYPSSPPSFSLATKDFSRLSLDDEDEDEDWTRDDENMEVGNLSPPSSSLNSRKVSPSFRAALADVTHSGSGNGNSAPNTDRPRSHIFDWSEPSSAEKLDSMGNSPRPKTAHVKQIADGRGGRTIGRRGPSALHIRSQSVPVVPDVAGQRDHSKLTPKFGTWGLGGKGVSEDWDGDFEFNEAGDGGEGNENLESSGMLVPPAIQASQANVVGHVGQIREVCLLVEDLKRLRLLAKEKGLLNGPSASLWKEAEGIIALAVPDEEDPTLSPPHSPSSIVFEHEIEDDQYHERGPEGDELSKADVPFELLNRHGQPTGFIYDGNTVRRRSVFSPEDDIFGAGALNNPPTRDHLRPPSTSPRHSSMKSSSDVARSLMETMHQHRASSDPILQNMTSQSSKKMPFDTTSLKDLVNRASHLSRALADLVRKADGSQSPDASPKRESSPAFTRVFTPTEPMVNSSKHLPRSHSNNSTLSGSIDASPTRSLGQRMHMMTVV
jgi:Septation protein etd1